jgi:dihydroxy-acid dehydratase
MSGIYPEELETRRAAFGPRRTPGLTGYRRLVRDHVLGADRGCDLDFCLPSGEPVEGP